MDNKSAKLALARKKLKDHQEKKLISVHTDDNPNLVQNIKIQDVQNAISDTFDNTLQYENKDDQKIAYDMKTNHVIKNLDTPETINVTEVLISNKRNLEKQINELQSKLAKIEYDYEQEINNKRILKQQISDLENDLKNISDRYLIATEEIQSKTKTIENLNTTKSSLSNENSNLLEQLEFTKTILTAKETENAFLHNQISNLQNQIDVSQLQLQQLSNGSEAYSCHNNAQEQNEQLSQKISSLEQQLQLLQKERDQINLHYEHYVGELNEQLRSLVIKNEELTKEVQNLSNRENSLIDQISDMEIRLQSYNNRKETVTCQNIDLDLIQLQQDYDKSQEMLKDISSKYEQLQKQYLDSETKVTQLNQIKQCDCNHENISFSKLNADITNDKVAAQRATEQNKKLKTDLKELEEAFIKISKDKLELTEKIVAEKYLNRELTIKLAEVEEQAKELHIKLMAKDDEMIRLQTNLRDAEKRFDQLLEDIKESNGKTVTKNNEEDKLIPEASNIINIKDHLHSQNCLKIQSTNFESTEEINSLRIPREDAMVKLQERFLKIMEEVADLSDEKHRLEHIILQLQNETDTICEYVALYQQQRSLLKKREEERSAQIKIFQTECDQLKNQLEELNSILIKFAEDKELSSYFQIESRHDDIAKVMHLLSSLKTNSLIDPNKNILEIKNFYPCNCCSGKLINV